MTDKQIKQLADKAWQEVWSDHLKNQEDSEINKHSFYQGFMKCSMYLKDAMKALEQIASTDYRGNRPQESVFAYNALEQLRKECEK